MPKVIRIHLGFPAIRTLHDWLKTFAPFSHPITDPIDTHVSRSSRQLHVFDLSFDWSIGLSVSNAIGQSDNFGLVSKTALKKY